MTKDEQAKIGMDIIVEINIIKAKLGGHVLPEVRRRLGKIKEHAEKLYNPLDKSDDT